MRILIVLFIALVALFDFVAILHALEEDTCTTNKE